MDEVAVDIDQAGAVVLAFDDVSVPDLLVKRAGLGCHDGPAPRKADAG
jgi:hypothetical protein